MQAGGTMCVKVSSPGTDVHSDKDDDHRHFFD